MAFKNAMAHADPVLLEPIVLLTISVPEYVVGDVIGDLNSRRGRPLGMEAKGSATEIKAEVPMAEVLDYARDLRRSPAAAATTRWSSRATRRSRPTSPRR